MDGWVHVLDAKMFVRPMDGHFGHLVGTFDGMLN